MADNDDSSPDDFHNYVEKLLTDSSPEALRLVLSTLAKGLPPSTRENFLQLLRLGREAYPKPLLATDVYAEEGDEGEKSPDNLLKRIDSLIQEMEDEAANPSVPYRDPYEEPYEPYDDYGYDDEAQGGFGAFVDPLEALFQEAGAVFDAGDLSLARQAYEGLFPALAIEDDYGRGLTLAHLAGLDATRVQMNYLRAVYHTESLDTRPAAIFQVMKDHVARPGSLQGWKEVLAYCRQDLPEQDVFLQRWIDHLKTLPGDAQADRWLREAVVLQDGIAGLETLARQQSESHPIAWIDWLDTLRAQGEVEPALSVAREALDSLPRDWQGRAEVADRLCEAAATLDDEVQFRFGAHQGFLAKPEERRLFQWWQALPPEQRTQVMQATAEDLRQRLAQPRGSSSHQLTSDPSSWPFPVTESILVHAYLLGRQWNEARRRWQTHPQRHEFYSRHPQGMVVTFLLTALAERPLNRLPTNLGRLWKLAFSENMFVSSPAYGTLRSLNHGPQPPRLPFHRIGDPNRAYQILLAEVDASALAQTDALDWCQAQVLQQVDNTLRRLQRDNYSNAADFVVAVAEVLCLRSGRDRAESLIQEVRDRYRRFRAFQKEIKRARVSLSVL